MPQLYTFLYLSKIAGRGSSHASYVSDTGISWWWVSWDELWRLAVFASCLQLNTTSHSFNKADRTINKKKQEEGAYLEPSFPEDFGERLERLIELAGLSREEFAQRLGIDYERVAEWFEGAELTGGEVWHVARLAWSIPGGLEIIVPEAGGGTE